VAAKHKVKKTIKAIAQTCVLYVTCNDLTSIFEKCAVMMKIVPDVTTREIKSAQFFSTVCQSLKVAPMSKKCY